MGQLSDWANKNSPFLRLADGEEVDAVYVGFKPIPNRFDLEKEVIRYTLLVDGVEKTWENGSPKIAKFFDTLEGDENIHIKRIGEGNKTKYEVTLVEK